MIEFGIVVAAVIVFGVILLVALYMIFLASLYPSTIRTDEVFYVRTNDLWILRVCRYRKERASGEPVLLVHGMGANQNNFTSPKNNCLVDYLKEKGYDCWTVDLRGCKTSEPPFERTRSDVRMEDYFKEDIPAVIEQILKVTHYEKVHWIGHSMGGMLLYAYTLHSGDDLIASGTTLGSPIDFKDVKGMMLSLTLLVAQKFPVVSGNVARGLVPIMKTLHLGSVAFPINQRNLPSSMSAGHFINMLEDPLPLLTKQVRKWRRSGKYTLLDGELDVAANIHKLPVPLLAFFAQKDPFINIKRAKEWFESIENPDKKMVICAKAEGFVENYSHCDLAFGKNAIKEIFDPIQQWLNTHSCPVRTSMKDEAERLSITSISEDKRARILSGYAYAHLIDDAPNQDIERADNDNIEPEVPQDTNMEETELALEAPKPTTKKKTATKKKTVAKKKVAAKTKAAAKKKTAPKKKVFAKTKATAKKKAAALTKETPAKKRTATKKAAASTKETPAKKRAAIKKAAAKKKAVATKARSAKKQTPPEDEGPSPEALQKANQAREERNTVFSELMASLSKPLETDHDTD